MKPVARKCSKCGKTFWAKSHNTKYCSVNCGQFTKLIQRKKHPKYQEYIRSWNLKKKFGITVEEYEVMLRTQGGKCGICNQFPRGKHRFAVDHDHQTGKIRGLLCLNCNNGIGRLNDSVELLNQAIEYLKRYQ